MSFLTGCGSGPFEMMPVNGLKTARNALSYKPKQDMTCTYQVANNFLLFEGHSEDILLKVPFSAKDKFSSFDASGILIGKKRVPAPKYSRGIYVTNKKKNLKFLLFLNSETLHSFMRLS